MRGQNMPLDCHPALGARFRPPELDSPSCESKSELLDNSISADPPIGTLGMSCLPVFSRLDVANGAPTLPYRSAGFVAAWPAKS